MCTWYDKENPDIKSSYKLPHHTAKGHKTVWRGVAAAMAALLGARGGVNIPASDRKGVYNHLAKHYKEFDKEVPKFKELDELEDAETEINELKNLIERLEEKVDSILKRFERLEKPNKSKPKYDDLLKGRIAGQPSKKPNPFNTEAAEFKKINEIFKTERRETNA